MRVNASINEPFLLATYGTSQRLSKSGSGSKKQKSLTNVFATHGKASGSSDGYATVTAQADGIHVLDVSALHPVVSHTLGPVTTFSCPAVTLSTQQGSDKISTTYAAIESSVDIGSEENGRTLWMWRENLSGSLVDRAPRKKTSLLILHRISGLYTCEELPSRLFAQSQNGDVTILDADLNLKHTRPPTRDSLDGLRTFVYSRRSCSFVPPRIAPSHGAIIVHFCSSAGSTHVDILSIDEDDQCVELGSCSVPLKRTQISDITCSDTGYLSVLTRDGYWHSFELRSTDAESIELRPATETFRLAGLSFISESGGANEDISLLPLGSSHVLLAAISKSPNQEIVLLLWDLQYSVLLASNTKAIPSSLTQSKDTIIEVDLVAASSTQCLLLLAPVSRNSGRKPQADASRSSVLVIPFTVPAVSTIANAMGRASAGVKWTESSSSSALPGPPPHDPARTRVLATMRTAMQQNLPQAANVAFFEWEKREKAAGKTTDPTTALEVESLPILSHTFVKDLITMVLQPEKPPNTPYSSEVLRYLLNRQVLSGGMVEGGLIDALRSKGDWKSIDLALKNVLDLTEIEIIRALQVVVVEHRKNAAPNAMDVDSTSDVPPLPAFLATCIVYPISPTPLRTAIRNALKDAEDILAVVEVLDNWIRRWGTREIKLLPSNKEISKNEHGVFVLKSKEKEVQRDLPPLNKVLVFLQTLLDASFLTLLQYPASHRTLRNIFSHIEPELNVISQMEQLRGPLENFAKAHGKAIKEAGEDKRKQPVVDWRRRRKQAHEQAGLAVGLYQLEELVL